MIITLIIGNTDNKLTQAEWSNFVKDVENELILASNPINIFFSGGPATCERFQNFAWTFEIKNKLDRVRLQYELKKLAREYKQDAISWIEGKTIFLQPEEEKELQPDKWTGEPVTSNEDAEDKYFSGYAGNGDTLVEAWNER